MKRIWNIKKKSGVSPVIATILMVAITVVLAAVLYVMVMNMSSNQGSTAPQASFAGTVVSGTVANVTFGSVSKECGVSQFKFILQDTSAGTNPGIYLSDGASGKDRSGSSLNSTAPIATVASGAIVYWDVANNGAINVGDSLAITLTGGAVGHSYKLSMVWSQSGDVITYTTFNY